MSVINSFKWKHRCGYRRIRRSCVRTFAIRTRPWIQSSRNRRRRGRCSKVALRRVLTLLV